MSGLLGFMTAGCVWIAGCVDGGTPGGQDALLPPADTETGTEPRQPASGQGTSVCLSVCLSVCPSV